MAKSNFSALILFLVLFAVAVAAGAAKSPQKPRAQDKCPVCGMFVAKYPNFAAQIQFRDGGVLHFDGNKDLFKCYLDLPRYAPGRKQADVAAIYVTSYYDLKLVDGFAASYVTGSDILGPMGRELIPFANESEAREFLRDHKGKAILRFREVTRGTVAALD